MVKGKDKEKGPSANQLRGLTYSDNKPAFLRNISTALSGTAPSSRSDRPPIPTRPGGADDGDDEEFDNNDYGEEAPQIVVLNEGKHLTAEEAEREKLNSADRPPIEKVQKREGTLKFSSNSGSGPSHKRKIRGVGVYDDVQDNLRDAEDEMMGDSFADLVKRAKVDPNAGTVAKERAQKQTPAEAQKDATAAPSKAKTKTTKEERAAMKAKRKAAAKMLSFED